ncbi:MAG: primosomal protein N' [Prevotella sp.]|nr:primosomal protein N' [Prevotella sp.]
MLYVDVILPVPLDGLFTYSVPTEQESQVQPFVRVVVPFGITKRHIALVVRVHRDAPDSSITVKPLISVLDAKPVLLPHQYKLWQWISSYYMCPLGDILVAALPQGMKKEGAYRPRVETYIRIGDSYRNERSIHNALDMLCRSPKQLEVFTTYLQLSGLDSSQFSVKEVTREELINASHATAPIVKALVDKGFLMLYDKEVGRLNSTGEAHPERIKPLSPAQQAAYESLDIQASNLTSLLHGVTSSGKTEIYIHLIQEAIDRGEQVMYLLPEIALTVQMTQRLQHVFGDRLGIYHSKYSDAERVEIWQKQLSDHPYDVILGARSAVFLPYQRLGLVIIDEEHETSFKQQDPAPRYHARSVAMMMAQWAKARVVLGTATPSAESYYNAVQGKYQLVELNQRYKDLRLPQINVVDTKDLYRRRIMRSILSPQLETAVHVALDRGEQAIIFQNRRGYSPIVECHQCGWSPRCPHCDVSLTHHKTTDTLTCHYCGYTVRMPKTCPECGNVDLYNRGAGTEKVEDIITATFPKARVARMDLDTTCTRNAYERIIAEFSSGKTNLLIGTQMVTKGLDFDNVSVVGILSADTMLNQPDFRAYEHAFMMMTQVAGRAGRKGRRGQVILQTSRPDLPVIKHIVAGDYKAFFSSLIRERKLFRYPPFTRLIYIYLKHKDEHTVDTAAIELGSRLRQSFADRVLGPDKPAVARVKSLHIRKLMLKLENNLSITSTRTAIKQAVATMMQDARYKSLLVYYDVDPG